MQITQLIYIGLDLYANYLIDIHTALTVMQII